VKWAGNILETSVLEEFGVVPKLERQSKSKRTRPSFSKRIAENLLQVENDKTGLLWWRPKTFYRSFDCGGRESLNHGLFTVDDSGAIFQEVLDNDSST
jgi:hypothetical protein